MIEFCKDCFEKADRLYWMLVMTIFLAFLGGAAIGLFTGLKLGGW